MPEIALPPLIGKVLGSSSRAMEMLFARATVAGHHPLLQRIRSGSSHAKEIAAWVQSRCCLAECLAKKEILVLAKVGDREARRLWTSRLLAIDGHGDFYGPSKQGLIGSWRWLGVQLQPDGPAAQSSADLITTLDRHFDRHLRFIQSAAWVESLGASLVDDWVVRNDWMTAAMLPGANTPAGLFRGGWRPAINTELSVNTLSVLATQLGPTVAGELDGQTLKSIDSRVELEHTILNAVRAFASHELP